MSRAVFHDSVQEDRMSSRQARMSVALALVVLLAALVSAQGQAPASDSEQQVRAAMRQMLQASQANDKDAASRLIADDAVWVDRSGGVITKAQLLEMSPSAPRDIDIATVSVRGDNALATGVAHLSDGGNARFLQQWVNQGGQWKLLSHQSTTIGANPAAVPVATSGIGRSKTAERASTWRSRAPVLDSKDQKAVWKTEMALQGAYLRGDAETYAKLTADDYIRVMADGKQFSKSEFLQQVKQNAGKQGGDLQSNDVRIIVNGDSAREIMTIWGIDPGGAPLGLLRLTRYFSRTPGGHWQQVATAVTRVPDK
jgi:ketosteroid isomerase-like protein